MLEYLVRTSHLPRPLPSGRWRVTQRWNDLLYAHWPVEPAAIARLLPEGLQVDTFEGSAWLGILPFWMDRIKLRGLPSIPGARTFPELTVRTYARDQQTGVPGLWFLSLDANNLLAAAVGRAFYRLPYHWAQMSLEQRTEREFSFYSRRRFASQPVLFQARYRGLGPTPKLAENRIGTLEHFLLERHCLYSINQAGEPIRANLHHVSWPLEDAAAEIEQNDLAKAAGIHLGSHAPVLHYCRRMAVYAWPAERVRPLLVARPVAVAATPSG